MNALPEHAISFVAEHADSRRDGRQTGGGIGTRLTGRDPNMPNGGKRVKRIHLGKAEKLLKAIREWRLPGYRGLYRQRQREGLGR
jgi:hypothetical protein